MMYENHTPLAVIALAEEEGLPRGLCWKCSRDQGFYDSPCECGAINPNWDLEGALAQQDAGLPERR